MIKFEEDKKGRIGIQVKGNKEDLLAELTMIMGSMLANTTITVQDILYCLFLADTEGRGLKAED